MIDPDMPAEPTLQARKECAEFLVEMLRIGWLREQLDDLEKLWWIVRDNRGNVRQYE